MSIKKHQTQELHQIPIYCSPSQFIKGQFGSFVGVLGPCFFPQHAHNYTLEPPLYGSPNNGVLLYPVKIESTEFIYYMFPNNGEIPLPGIAVLRNTVFRSRKFPTIVLTGTEIGYVRTAKFQFPWFNNAVIRVL